MITSKLMVKVSIGGCAFMNCTMQETVFIPTTAKSIGRFAFSGCIRLSNVIFMGNEVHIDKQAFEGCISYKQQ